jgi:hypothetical protein
MNRLNGSCTLIFKQFVAFLVNPCPSKNVRSIDSSSGQCIYATTLTHCVGVQQVNDASLLDVSLLARPREGDKAAWAIIWFRTSGEAFMSLLLGVMDSF